MTVALALDKAAMSEGLTSFLMPPLATSTGTGLGNKTKNDHFKNKSNMNAEVFRGKSVLMSATYSEMYQKINGWMDRRLREACDEADTAKYRW